MSLLPIVPYPRHSERITRPNSDIVGPCCGENRSLMFSVTPGLHSNPSLFVAREIMLLDPPRSPVLLKSL